MAHSPFDTLSHLATAKHQDLLFHSLPALERAGIGKISRLPVSLRIVLEALVRHCDGKRVAEKRRMPIPLEVIYISSARKAARRVLIPRNLDFGGCTGSLIRPAAR